MPEESKQFDSFIANVVNDPAKPPETLLLQGFLGASSEADSTRVYADATLESYVDIANADIIHREPLPKEQSPLGGYYVWVKKDAGALPGSGEPDRKKASFLEGPISAEAVAVAAPKPQIVLPPKTVPLLACHPTIVFKACPPSHAPLFCPPPRTPFCPPPISQLCPTKQIVCGPASGGGPQCPIDTPTIPETPQFQIPEVGGVQAFAAALPIPPQTVAPVQCGSLGIVQCGSIAGGICPTPQCPTPLGHCPSVQSVQCGSVAGGVCPTPQCPTPAGHCPSVHGFQCPTVQGFHCPSVAGFQCPSVAGFHCPSVNQYHCPSVLQYHCPSVLQYHCPSVNNFHCPHTSLCPTPQDLCIPTPNPQHCPTPNMMCPPHTVNLSCPSVGEICPTTSELFC